MTGPLDRPYMDNLARVLPVLREHTLSKVVVTFDGGGDQGSIDAVRYEPAEYADDTIYLDVFKVESTFNHDEKKWVRLRKEINVPLSDAIEALTNDYLEETDVNWYDSNGGFGELVIDVDAGTCSLEVNTCFMESGCMESGCEFFQTLEIGTGDIV